MFNNGFGGEGNPYAQNYATGGGASGGGFLANGSQNDSPSGKVRKERSDVLPHHRSAQQIYRSSSADKSPSFRPSSYTIHAPTDLQRSLAITYRFSTTMVASQKRAGNNTLRPVTIRQILNAEQPHPDADFTLDGAELGQLTFVAVVRNVSRNATNVAYSVEDGTGQIEVRQWLDSSSDDSSKTSDIRQNVYVRVLGTLKSFQNRRSISAGHMRPVIDYNEVMFHRLEAVHSHLQATRGPNASTANGGASTALFNQGGANQNNDINAYSGSNKQNILDQYKSLDELPRQIMAIVTQEAEKHHDGVHVNLIARMLKGVDVSDVKSAVEDLSSEGYLYTAADDDHVLPTA